MKRTALRSARTSFILCAAIFVMLDASIAQRLVLTDPQHHARLPEVIQIPMSEALRHTRRTENFKAINAATHEPLISQIYQDPDTAKSFLLIAIEIPESGKLVVDLLPADDMQMQAPLVFGREAPERKDDYAWENKYVAYRVYGPALEATGEITSGIDVWSKRVPNFVIDSFYKHDAEGQRTHNPKLSYHVDDGVGLDSYLVGPTRGCGGTGVLSNGKLWLSKNYTHLKQISSGPVRFEFELTYAPWDANGLQVTETKRITLDAGSRLNKIQSTFTFTGAGAIEAAAGLAIHDGAEFEPLANGQILSVWDTPQNPTAGRIATGMIAAPSLHPAVQQLSPNALQIFRVHSGETFTYYAGSGWSKADMPTQQAWNNYLTSTLQQLQQPLKMRWQK